MARVADSTIEAIRQRIDIAELVREYVPELRRAGRSYKARCPFHQEKTPSFMVHPEKQIFHCFGCSEGGDAFKFLMKMESLSFTEAVAKLAERAGVAVARASESMSSAEREYLRLREALAFAQEFYHKCLKTAPEAEGARRYLAGRGLDPAVRDRFGLGYALPHGSAFLEAALRRVLAPDLLAKAGLVTLREGDTRYRDYFRGRILFPIRSVKGEVAGFGGRAQGDAEPKYLNGPETALFSKGRVLYGLFEGLSEVRKSRKAVLLEGYMDVLALHQFGIAVACAPLGTAVTPDHAALLKRYADQVTVVFDPDAAGTAASLRGADILLERGVGVRIATIPGGLDPDELIHQKGVAAMRECLDRAQDLPDFQASLELARLPGPPSAEEKSRIARAVLTTIARSSDEVLKREWIRRLAERLKADEESLLTQMRRLVPPAAAGSPAGRDYAAGIAPARRRHPAERGPAAPGPSAALPTDDKEILQVLLQRPDLAVDGNKVAEDDFAHPGARRIFARIRELAGEHADAEARLSGRLLDALSPEDAGIARALAVGEKALAEPEAELERLVSGRRLLRRYRALHERVDRMNRGELPSDPGVVREYNELFSELSRRRLMERL